MASQGAVLSFYSTQRHYKKFVLILCVLTWAAIFFISGTLFMTRRYQIANQMVSGLHSSLQEQINSLSSEVREGKSSAKVLTQVLHQKINETLASLDQKIRVLEKEYAEKRQVAFQALRSLHDKDQEKPAEQVMMTAKPESQLVARGPLEIKSRVNGKCVDSMEQPLGSDVELFSCHGQEGNQAWRHNELTRVIENKIKNMCLEADGGSDGSPVKTAICDERDTLQKWTRKELLFLLDDGAQDSKCLDFIPQNSRLVIKHCDNTKESQRWTY